MTGFLNVIFKYKYIVQDRVAFIIFQPTLETWTLIIQKNEVFYLSWKKNINFSQLIFQIFFVLRKKNSHVSTLHVIHHGCMPMSVWFGVKFTPGM